MAAIDPKIDSAVCNAGCVKPPQTLEMKPTALGEGGNRVIVDISVKERDRIVGDRLSTALPEITQPIIPLESCLPTLPELGEPKDMIPPQMPSCGIEVARKVPPLREIQRCRGRDRRRAATAGVMAEWIILEHVGAAVRGNTIVRANNSVRR